MPISRRLFLRSGAQALSAASLLGAVPGLAAATDKDRKSVSASDISVKDVGGLAVFAGSGCNVVGLAGPDGALLVDGGLAVNSGALMKAVAGNLKTRRIQTLINTHWHPEQTGSNEAVGKAGGTIIAHEVSRLALARRERSALYEGFYGPLPPKAIPGQTTYNTGTLMFAGEQVDYRYLPAAHTNGDLFVHFPKRNVIVAGGPVAADHWPVMDYINGGFMHGFVRSYEILAEVARPDTIIIPANGPTLTGAEIVKQKDMYWALFKQFFIDFNKGFGPNDIVEAHPLKDYEARYGDPAQFLDYAYRSLQLATIPH
ncbi:MAG TPA: MBL fold metallo-hydrolase [Steroidobacteraceae bacterium]|jgi:glyoxylase-like metal-dependent hydrolase (beta-lactamase superfamily II)|nr:MBL fold metallo-hydrolase [Steroidobacteraceae bacterium]